MALLTEKQLMELANICIKSQDSNQLINSIKTWNDRQQPTQFEPDWNEAPEWAFCAIVKFYWIGKSTWKLGFDIAEYERPKPAPIYVAHPHSQVIAKYAEVAARRSDPWAEFYFKHPSDDTKWLPLTKSPSFNVDVVYQWRGEDKAADLIARARGEE